MLGAAAVAAGLAVVVVSALRQSDRLRRRAFSALALTVLIAGYVWWQAWVDIAGGLPTRALPLLAASRRGRPGRAPC